MFKNRPNRILKDENGKAHWASRSVAVVAVIIWRDKFLILKRGKNVSRPNNWCVPCGYLDWDESAAECVVREVYEETNVNLRDYKVSGLESPYEVVTEPSVNWKQDIAIHFKVVIESEVEPAFNLSMVDEGETTDINWVTVDELPNYKFAFNHDKRILKYL